MLLLLDYFLIGEVRLGFDEILYQRSKLDKGLCLLFLGLRLDPTRYGWTYVQLYNKIHYALAWILWIRCKLNTAEWTFYSDNFATLFCGPTRYIIRNNFNRVVFLYINPIVLVKIPGRDYQNLIRTLIALIHVTAINFFILLIFQILVSLHPGWSIHVGAGTLQRVVVQLGLDAHKT